MTTVKPYVALQALRGLSSPYRELKGPEARLLVHLAQPGVLSSRMRTASETAAAEVLVMTGLARRRDVDEDSLRVSATLRGEELARYLERKALGMSF